MSKYDMLCEECGIVEIEHSIHEDHPDLHSCGNKMTRYFGDQRRPAIEFKPSRGGGVDDWASVRMDPQPMTSVERETAYD